MRAWPILFLIPLLGCASVPEEEEEILPCPEALAPAEHGPWRLVQEDDFSFCVPTEWDRAGTRAWQWGSGRLEWDRRPPRVRRVQQSRARGLGPPPPSRPREASEVIGGHVVELWIFESPGAYHSLAHWSDPMDLHFAGGGLTPTAGELVRMVYRTVRFPSS